jgi:hypothetical protein
MLIEPIFDNLDAMPGMAVYLDRPPRSATLVVWGRAPDAWWGCVIFRVTVTAASDTAELPAAAWVPSASITRPPWSSVIEIPRVQLSHDRTAWPAPQGWPSWYAGVWPAGDLTLPPGLTAATGPAWRRRR